MGLLRQYFYIEYISMRNNLENMGWQQPTPEEWARYLRENTQPPLNPDKLSAELLVDEREIISLRTSTGGDFTLLVKYRGKEAVVASFEEVGDSDLKVVQLQGGHRHGYRVMTGMHAGRFVADQAVAIVEHPATTYTRLTFPNIINVQGDFVPTSESTAPTLRYLRFIAYAQLGFSELENQFVRDFSAPAREI